jgi:hypothetical protein
MLIAGAVVRDYAGGKDEVVEEQIRNLRSMG